jgi:hypothetical protein
MHFPGLVIPKEKPAQRTLVLAIRWPLWKEKQLLSILTNRVGGVMARKEIHGMARGVKLEWQE